MCSPISAHIITAATNKTGRMGAPLVANIIPSNGNAVGRRGLLLPNTKTTSPQCHHLRGEVQDSHSGGLWVEAARVDVGDEIAVGVGVRWARLVSHVSGQAFCGGKARAFTDQ